MTGFAGWRVGLSCPCKEMEQKLTIKLGAFLVIGVTLLSMLNKLF